MRRLIGRLVAGIIVAVGLVLVWTVAGRADGLPGPALSMKDISPATMAFACSLGAYGSGSFVRNNTSMLGTSFNQGDALAGVGPEVGCDWIGKKFVFGFGGDYTLQSDKGASSLLGITDSIPFGNEWSVWGRVGVFTNSNRDTMLYLKGGIVGVESRTMTVTTLSAPFSGATGPFVGAGLEANLSGKAGLYGWNGFLEYRHEMLDASSSRIGGIVPVSLQTDDDRVIAGLKYRFGGN